MSTTNFCGKCGNKFNPGTLYCSNCGANIQENLLQKVDNTQQTTSSITNNPSNEKITQSVFIKIMKGIGIALIGFIAIVLLFIAFTFYLTSGLLEPIKNQLSAIQNGTIQKAYFLYTSKGFQHEVSMDKFKQIINQYPSLKDNESASFTSREIKDNKGVVIGTLKSKKGVSTPIKYLLIKEEGQWKIVGFIVNPKNTTLESDSPALYNVSAEISKTPDNSATQVSSSSDTYKLYEDKTAKFSIKYPVAWNISSNKPGTLICTGKKGTPSYFSMIIIHTIPAKKIGGQFSSAEKFVESLKKQAMKQFTNVTFLAQGQAELPQNPKKFQGKYLSFTFTYKNIAFKRLEFVIFREDGLALYDWSYISPQKYYDADLPIAKTMYESWVIN
ncbi:MAG: DUF4864 domain-containing protein [Legionella sp.]|jgi:hypothetical protein